MTVQDITVYTDKGAIQYTVISSADNFEELLCNALGHNECVLLETIEHTQLIINPLRAIAVEISASYEHTEEISDEISPPIKNY